MELTKSQASHIKSTYDLTVDQYISLVDKQNSRCLICNLQSKKLLRVDHDHETGFVRGLLCDSCNTSLGFFKDDPKLLNRASNYLKKHNSDIQIQENIMISREKLLS